MVSKKHVASKCDQFYQTILVIIVYDFRFCNQHKKQCIISSWANMNLDIIREAYKELTELSCVLPLYCTLTNGSDAPFRSFLAKSLKDKM